MIELGEDRVRCQECSAAWRDGVDCDAMLGAVTSWEWQDDELAALHFLTVATFNLQHSSRFSDAALASLRQVYIEHIDNGLTVSAIRRIHRDLFAGSARVRSLGAERAVISRNWPKTIADVHDSGPGGAAQRVLAWARSVRPLLEGEMRPRFTDTR